MMNFPMFSTEHKADNHKMQTDFYDNQKDADMKWQKRLLSLSIDDQLKISKKYYGGSMPWNKA